MGRRPGVTLVVAAEDGDQAQHLHVDPHEGQGQAERGQPGLLLRRAVGDAVLDLLEVEGQEERADQDRQDADDRAERAMLRSPPLPATPKATSSR